MTDILFDPDNVIQGITTAEQFSFTITETPLARPETDDPVTKNKDGAYIVSYTAGLSNNATIDVTKGTIDGELTFQTKLGTEHTSIDQSGNITHNTATAEDVTFFIGVAGVPPKQYKRNCFTTDSLRFIKYAPFEDLSLGAHCTAQVDALIEGHLGGSDAAQVYWQTNNSNPSAPDATLNPTRFCAPIDFTASTCCLTGSNEQQYGIDLISPRHGLGATHTTFTIGDIAAFQNPDGSTYQIVTVIGKENILDNGNNTDLTLLYLSDPITVIQPYKVMPKGWIQKYAPSIATSSSIAVQDALSHMPILRMAYHNDEDTAESWMDISRLTAVPQENYKAIQGAESNRHIDWTNETIPGDSGGGIFLIINGEPVLIQEVWHASGLHADIAEYQTEIETAMNTLAGTPQGTYTVQHPNLSQFKTYD